MSEEKNRKIENFIKVPVYVIQELEEKFSGHKRLDIILTPDPSPDLPLPYADSKNFATGTGFKRERAVRVVARGDNKPYHVVKKNGGFFPYACATKGNWSNLYLMSNDFAVRTSDKYNVYLYKDPQGNFYYKSPYSDENQYIEAEGARNLLNHLAFNQPATSPRSCEDDKVCRTVLKHVISKGQAKNHRLLGDAILNVKNHRLDSTGGSGYVAASASMQVVRCRNETTTVYLLKGYGLVPPSESKGLGEQIESELEYSMPGGFDEQDIIAYRNVQGKKITEQNYRKFGGSPIYIRESFIQSYLPFVQIVLDAFLDDDEYCKIPIVLKNRMDSVVQVKSTFERVPTSDPRDPDEENPENEFKNLKYHLLESSDEHEVKSSDHKNTESPQQGAISKTLLQIGASPEESKLDHKTGSLPKAKDALNSQSIISKLVLPDSYKSNSPGRIVVFSLDYDGCADILFWETHGNRWFYKLLENNNYRLLEKEFKPYIDLVAKHHRHWPTLEAILSQDEAFQGKKRAICKPLAGAFMENLEKLIRPGDKVFFFSGSNRQFAHTEIINMRENSNGSSFKNYPLLEKRTGWIYLRLNYEDIYLGLPAGNTIDYFHSNPPDEDKARIAPQEIERELNDRFELLFPKKPDKRENYNISINSRLKSLFLQAQMQFVHQLNLEQECDFFFIDNDTSFTISLYSFLENLNVIPPGIDFLAYFLNYECCVGNPKNFFIGGPCPYPHQPMQSPLNFDLLPPSKALEISQEIMLAIVKKLDADSLIPALTPSLRRVSQDKKLQTKEIINNWRALEQSLAHTEKKLTSNPLSKNKKSIDAQIRERIKVTIKWKILFLLSKNMGAALEKTSKRIKEKLTIRELNLYRLCDQIPPDDAERVKSLFLDLAMLPPKNLYDKIRINHARLSRRLVFNSALKSLEEFLNQLREFSHPPSVDLRDFRGNIITGSHPDYKLVTSPTDDSSQSSQLYRLSANIVELIGLKSNKLASQVLIILHDAKKSDLSEENLTLLWNEIIENKKNITTLTGFASKIWQEQYSQSVLKNLRRLDSELDACLEKLALSYPRLYTLDGIQKSIHTKTNESLAKLENYRQLIHSTADQDQQLKALEGIHTEKDHLRRLNVFAKKPISDPDLKDIKTSSIALTQLPATDSINSIPWTEADTRTLQANIQFLKSFRESKKKTANDQKEIKQTLSDVPLKSKAAFFENTFPVGTHSILEESVHQTVSADKQ